MKALRRKNNIQYRMTIDSCQWCKKGVGNPGVNQTSENTLVRALYRFFLNNLQLIVLYFLYKSKLVWLIGKALVSPFPTLEHNRRNNVFSQYLYLVNFLSLFFQEHLVLAEQTVIMTSRENGLGYQRIKRSDDNRSESLTTMTDSENNTDTKNLLSGEKPAINMANRGRDIHLFGWSFNKVILLTHVNIFLYSACFWIQNGTLPVCCFSWRISFLNTTLDQSQLIFHPLAF